MSIGPFIARCGAGLAVSAMATIALSYTALAQIAPLPGIGNAVRQSEETRRGANLPATVAPPVLPRLVEPPFTLKDNEKLFVRTLKIEGSPPGDDAQVRAILAPFEHRKLTIAEIYAAADQVTTFYRNQGYLVAKAYVPAQDARKGTLRLKIVAGTYGSISITNESRLREDYLRGVIDHALAASPVIHKDALERAMLLTSDLAGAGTPRIAIGPGRQPETSDLAFTVPGTRLVDGYLLGDNYGSPFTGRNRLSGGVNVNSPLGYGDRLSAFGLVTEDSELVNGRVAYSAPIGYSGLRAEIGGYRTTYTLGGIYQDLNATGTADAFTATVSYPILRQINDSIFLSGNFTHKSLNDNVLGISLARRNMDEGTLALQRETVGSLFNMPWKTNATLSLTYGNVKFPDPAQLAFNLAGANTAGDFSKISLLVTTVLALTDKLSLSTSLRAQKSLSGNLDSSEQLGLTGYWGIRSYDEGLAGDSGYIFAPELKYALPDLQNYKHSIGAFTDIGAVWLEDSSFTTLQKGYTQLNDVGLGYYATYEYLPTRFLLLKAQVARTYGSNNGALSYDRSTKGLLQIGLTF
jgi:hemolysin activation/secretion protein